MDTSKLLRLLPAGVGVIVAGILLSALLMVEPGHLSWGKAAALVIIAGFVFAIVATIRYGLGGLMDAPVAPTGEDGQAIIRSRLAPLVIGIGTLGILTVAISVILVLLQNNGTPETYMGIFSTVVTVFATWVGAVIAFYFSNESFRQAAQASGAIKGDPTEFEPVTAPHRMIPVDKITGLVLGTKPDDTSPELPKDKDAITIGQVKAKLSSTVSRVIIFSKPGFPIFIVRDKLLGTLDNGKTLADYRALDKNASDALNFRFIPETATVGDARRLLKTYATVDLFVTATGSPEEPVKGWLTDTQLA